MTLKEAERITGGLSWPSKMPCPAYNLPASSCNIGSTLSLVDGTVCSRCYARKGRYLFPNVRKSLENRFLSLDVQTAENRREWVDAMILLIDRHAPGYFRWHDSGDLLDSCHYGMVLDVVRGTPDIEHYLPTKEWMIVRNYPADLPENLNVRLSSPMIDFIPKFRKPLDSFCTNTVLSGPVKIQGVSHICEATVSRHKCEDCRICWNKSIKCVGYVLH